MWRQSRLHTLKMKHFILSILVVVPFYSVAQNLRHTGFYNELNLVTSDTEFEPINVLTGGAGFFKHMPVSNSVAISLNTGYQRKGFNALTFGYDYFGNPYEIVTVEHRVDMFHLSLGTKIYLNSLISFEIAPVLNLVLVGTADKSPESQSFLSYYEGGYDVVIPTNNFNDFEYGVVLRLNIQPISRWYISWAYDQSLSDAAEGAYYLTGQGDNLRFSTFQLRIAWAFWEQERKKNE